jgi:ubiquinol-cytochrome c reductase cytochrome c1 subunit
MRALAAVAAFVACGVAGAAGGPETRMEPYAGNPNDEASLQRGAKLFVNYCLNCHSAQYMRYNRLVDLGLSEEQIRDNLIFTGAKIADPMVTGMTADDGKRWFGIPVPDLTLVDRVRGSEWVYNYLLGFYRDNTASGWNNLVFPGVSMPHVLWHLGGTQRLVTAEFDTHEAAKGALIQARGMGVIEPPPPGKAKWAVRTLAIDAQGQLSPVEYRQAMTDLVNYLDYMSEPVKIKRGTIGIIVLLFLGAVFPLVLWLKKEFWKDIR